MLFKLPPPHPLWLVPDSDVSCDSSEMVKAIIQTVQNQDKVLKDLFTHLRWGSTHAWQFDFTLSFTPLITVNYLWSHTLFFVLKSHSTSNAYL